MKTNLKARRIASFVVAGLLLSASGGCGGSPPEGDAKAPESQAVQAHSHAEEGETCFICDPAKRESGRLWCAEHACYENRCWVCQPQLEDKDRLYCKEHSLYEDECFLCHPEIKEVDQERDPGAQSSSASPTPGSSDVLFCGEHRVPEHECGICQPQRTAELEPGDELKVRFESVHSAAKAGLRTVSPERIEAQPDVGAFCEVRYNENALARITPLAPGIVRRVLVDVGTDVKAGDALVELHSAEIAAAKSAFVSATVNVGLKKLSFEREQGLAAKKISSQQELQEAEAAYTTEALTLSTTRQRLLNYGLSEREISRIEETQDGSAVLLVRAPFDGTLVGRAAVVGEAVEPGDALFSLADLSTMWLALSIPSDRAGFLEKGLEVEATLSGVVGSLVRGELTWINTSIDERSRLVQARAVVENEHRQLKAGMFGEASVMLAPRTGVLSVPAGAVQHFENRDYVFVKHEDDLYALRRVSVGRVSEDVYAVTAGLNPNEPVIVDGAFTAMSEFLKSRLGAGCVDD